MTCSNRASRFCVAALALLALGYCKVSTGQTAPTPAQSPSGSLVGTVVDSTGAVVPRAVITITNSTTNQAFSAMSGADGTFHFSNVPLGDYTLSAVLSGFSTFQKTVHIQPNESNSETITLAVASGTKVPSNTPGGGGGVNPPAPPQLSQGEQLTGSSWYTPDACATGTPGALAAKGILFVHRSLVLPKEASDDFGYRLGKRFLVYQVSVTNAATDFQYSVSDIVVDFSPIFNIRKGLPPTVGSDGKATPVPTEVPSTTSNSVFEASSQDLLMLRGVPEKGQDYDPRNMTLHILQGVGAVGAGVSGLTAFSDVMGSAMANFNGAFLQAFTGIAPDHTATQLNRLSDMAFTSNTLVGKLQTKKFAIFIPEAFVMPKDAEKKYWSDPRAELDLLPFDQLNICVDGILLIQAAATPDPTFSPVAGSVVPGTSVAISDSDTTAAIYYTTDGTVPTTNSSKYTAAIPIGAAGTPSVTIQAFAVSPNKAPSNTVVGIFSPTAPPPAPSSLAAAVNNNQVSLTWTASASATSYNIYRATSSGTEGTVPYKSGVVATTYVDPTTTHGTPYFYVVTAVSPAGESVKSNEVTETP